MFKMFLSCKLDDFSKLDLGHCKYKDSCANFCGFSGLNSAHFFRNKYFYTPTFC